MKGKTMTKQQRLIDILHMTVCPLSTDGSYSREESHYIREGACVICDKSAYGLAIQHDLAWHSPLDPRNER